MILRFVWDVWARELHSSLMSPFSGRRCKGRLVGAVGHHQGILGRSSRGTSKGRGFWAGAGETGHWLVRGGWARGEAAGGKYNPKMQSHLRGILHFPDHQLHPLFILCHKDICTCKPGPFINIVIFPGRPADPVVSKVLAYDLLWLNLPLMLLGPNPLKHDQHWHQIHSY